ncbi:DUF4345 family protein [Blastomonas fulva]|jgi:hypothetical protein|uniref:DUF4345 family protein n=1 Tax=Blastomonas fulva TaxID=1550728 RepID=UPI0025A4AAA0|nr:DUF4345 family protein [Blastomonas fulva]MDM7927616.1 DUF4345 family protein [Blastomonas fulva]MDM7965285.1 DUF4345 family protein [Blastomonas fulva]
MTWVIRLLVAAISALFLIIGVRAMLDPQSIITQFELGRQGVTGTSAIRADMGGFFVGTALAALIGLFPGKRQWLLGAAGMVALAFTGRAIGLLSDGLTANIAQSMIIEAITIALLVAAFGILNPRRREALAAESAAEAETQRLATEQERLAAEQNDMMAQNDDQQQRDRDLAQPIV